MSDLQSVIERAFENRQQIQPQNVSQEVLSAVTQTLEKLDSGSLRVAEPTEQGWQVNEWAKKAVLLSFRIRDNQKIDAGHTNYFDKVPLKYANTSEQEFKQMGVRVVPQAIVRNGCFVNKNGVKVLLSKLEMEGKTNEKDKMLHINWK